MARVADLCPQCGAKLEEDYCSHCGVKVREVFDLGVFFATPGPQEVTLEKADRVLREAARLGDEISKYGALATHIKTLGYALQTLARYGIDAEPKHYAQVDFSASGAERCLERGPLEPL